MRVRVRGRAVPVCFWVLAGDSSEHLTLRSATDFSTFLFLPHSLFCHGSALPFHPKSGCTTWSTVGVLLPGEDPSSPPLSRAVVLPAEMPMDTSHAWHTWPPLGPQLSLVQPSPAPEPTGLANCTAQCTGTTRSFKNCWLLKVSSKAKNYFPLFLVKYLLKMSRVTHKLSFKKVNRWWYFYAPPYWWNTKGNAAIPHAARLSQVALVGPYFGHLGFPHAQDKGSSHSIWVGKARFGLDSLRLNYSFGSSAGLKNSASLSYYPHTVLREILQMPN